MTDGDRQVEVQASEEELSGCALWPHDVRDAVVLGCQAVFARVPPEAWGWVQEERPELYAAVQRAEERLGDVDVYDVRAAFRGWMCACERMLTAYELSRRSTP